MPACTRGQNSLAPIGLLLILLPGCEPSFPAPRNGYNLEPISPGPIRLPAPTVVQAPDCSWREATQEHHAVALSIDGPVTTNQAFSFRGRIHDIPEDIQDVWIIAGFGRDIRNSAPRFRTAESARFSPQNGSIEYRVDVRAPPQPGSYYVFLTSPVYDGGILKRAPFSMTEVVIK